VVWDGRFEIVADRPGLIIEALRGQAARIDPRDRPALAAIPAAARPSSPVWRKLDEPSEPPRLVLAAPHAHLGYNGVRCRALCEARLAGAVGVVTREADVGTNTRMAHLPLRPYVVAGSKD